MGRLDVPQSGAASAGRLGGRLKAIAGSSGLLARSYRCRGVAKLVKASDFDSDMRGFESFLPCQTFC